MENHERAIMKIGAFFALILVAIWVFAQQPVDVRKVSVSPTGQQTAVNSDSVVCATDTGCVVKITASGTATAANSQSVVCATDTGCVSPNGDPCENPANTRTLFNVNAASTTAQVVVPATAAKKGYVCSFILDTQNSSGDTFILTDGTQMTNPCDNGTPTALLGSTTASQGIFVNPGVVYGNGAHTLWQTSAVNRQICVTAVSSTRFTANGYYVVQ